MYVDAEGGDHEIEEQGKGRASVDHSRTFNVTEPSLTLSS